MKLITKIARKMIQLFCFHRVCVEDMERINPDRVDGQCYKCGKILSAYCGLALPLDWDPNKSIRKIPNHGDFQGGKQLHEQIKDRFGEPK